MTQVVAAVAKDRVIMLADGMALDTGTGEHVSARKLFRLNDTMAVGISGTVRRGLPDILDTIPTHLEIDGIHTYSEVVAYLDDFVQKFDWKFKGKQSICLIVAGYDGSNPTITRIEHKQPIKSNPIADASGWGGDYQYLMDNLPEIPTSQFEFREAERVVMQLLATAETAVPDKIGDQELMWHVFPDRIEEKTKSYTDRLRKIHCKSIIKI